MKYLLIVLATFFTLFAITANAVDFVFPVNPVDEESPIKISYSPPVAFSDGSVLDQFTDLNHYTLYYGRVDSPEMFTIAFPANIENKLELPPESLPVGVPYEFAMTATGVNGVFSDSSEIVPYTRGLFVPKLIPNPPATFGVE